MSFGERFLTLWRQCSLTDRIIAFFTGILAFASIYQFIILNGQLDVMRNDQRAWINYSQTGGQGEIGKPIVQGINVKNTGKTPAKNVYAAFRLEILNATDGPSFDYSNKKLTTGFSGHAMYPNDNFSLGVGSLVLTPGTQTIESTILSQDLANKFHAGTIWFATEGLISYRDIFGKQHWMKVCLAKYERTADLITGPSGAQDCAAYNDTDD